MKSAAVPKGAKWRQDRQISANSLNCRRRCHPPPRNAHTKPAQSSRAGEQWAERPRTCRDRFAGVREDVVLEQGRLARHGEANHLGEALGVELDHPRDLADVDVAARLRHEADAALRAVGLVLTEEVGVPVNNRIEKGGGGGQREILVESGMPSHRKHQSASDQHEHEIDNITHGARGLACR